MHSTQLPKPKYSIRKPQKKAYHILWVLLFQVITPSTQAKCSREIVVPFSQDGADQWSNSGGRTGLSVDYLEEASIRTGCKFTYIDMPRARAWWMFNRGQVDLILGAVQSDRSDIAGEFFSQNIQERISFISLKSKTLISVTRQTILDSGLKISFVRGHDYGPQTDELIKILESQGRIVFTKDPYTMLRLLAAGRVDGGIALGSTITVYSRNMNLDDKIEGAAIEDLAWALGGLYVSRALPPDDRQFLARVFNDLNTEGFYSKLAQEKIKNQPIWITSSISIKN